MDNDIGYAHLEWLHRVAQQISDDYDRCRQYGTTGDANHAGHGAETTWGNFFKDWLPPGYGVGYRKYIVPESGSDSFETDIVIFRPSYPDLLRRREEVMAGGVAAAFSVKLTLDAGRLGDGVSRAARIKQGLKKRSGGPRGVIASPFPFGVLAHSHGWRAPKSTPARNIESAFARLDQKYAIHPRDSLDILCVADLGTWTTSRIAYTPPRPDLVCVPAFFRSEGAALTFFTREDVNCAVPPRAVLIVRLYERLSVDDPTLKPLAEGFRYSNPPMMGSGGGRAWRLSDVYEEAMIK